MYVLHHRCVRHFPCINKTCWMGGNPSMTTCTSYQIPYLPGDGLVVYKSWKIWSRSFYGFGGLWPGWKTSMCMYCIRDLSVLSYASTSHVKRVATHQWQLVPRITSHTSLELVWWFANPAESWPIIDLLVCGLDVRHPHVCVTFQACHTFPMYK